MRDLFGMVKNVFGMPQDEYYEEYEDENEDERDRRSYTGSENRYDEKKRSVSSVYNAYNAPEPGKVIQLHNDSVRDMKVVMLTPTSYDEGRTVSNHLKAFSPVIVKLEKLAKDEAQRVTDFIMGACYTMDGHVLEIKEDVFLVTPSIIHIEKEQEDAEPAKTGSLFSKFASGMR